MVHDQSKMTVDRAKYVKLCLEKNTWFFNNFRWGTDQRREMGSLHNLSIITPRLVPERVNMPTGNHAQPH